MTIPNIITIFRLFIVPAVIVAILQEEWTWAFVLFLVAGISDGLDGWIARKFDMRSEFGAIIDPLADKSLLVSIYITLAIVQEIPSWLAIIVVSRDVMIVMAFMVAWMMSRPMQIKPLFASKANTALQIGFATVVLGGLAFSVDASPVTEIAAYVIVALTVVTAAAYLVLWLRHMTR